MSYPACRGNCSQGRRQCHTPFTCSSDGEFITATGLHRIFTLGRIYTPEVQTAPSWLERIRRTVANWRNA